MKKAASHVGVDRSCEVSIHNGEGAVAQWHRGITRRDKLKVIFLKSSEAAGLEQIAAMFEDGQRVGCVEKNVPAHDCIEKLARTELTDIRLDASNVRDPFGGGALAQSFESARIDID